MAWRPATAVPDQVAGSEPGSRATARGRITLSATTDAADAGEEAGTPGAPEKVAIRTSRDDLDYHDDHV